MPSSLEPLTRSASSPQGSVWLSRLLRPITVVRPGEATTALLLALNVKRGTRLFPLLALSGSLGAAVGSQFAALLIPVLGVPAMLGVAAAVLALCALLFWLVERRETASGTPTERAAKAPKGSNAPRPGDNAGAFGLVLSNRYLLDDA